MGKKIKASVAMLNVLESWGVDHVYGIPGGSFNSTMDALYEKRDSVRYIQVRHEETGALAASAEAKLTGKIGVCFGTAGPGATHLFNGLYDAKMDRAPVLALVGQVISGAMNLNSFQELNENPMFVDVSVYNRTVMTAESLPFVVDEAIRKAYEYNGVAVVTIPVDFGFIEIDDVFTSAASSHRVGFPMPDEKDILDAAKLIEQAERPVLYVGVGAKAAREEIVRMSEHFEMPVVLSVLAKGLVAEDFPNYMGMAARVSTKPANEALAQSDLIVFVGSNFPFARFFFPPEAKFIQVDIDSSMLGSRHKTDVAILGDAGEAMRRITAAGRKRQPTGFSQSCRANRRNWLKWQKSFEDSTDTPLRPEPIFKHINRIADDDAIFVTDVGNVTIHAIRLLYMNGKDGLFTTSGLFATMGYGLPGGIAAKLAYPDRQVFTLSGDGGFAMVMQEIITQVRYKLPIINVVLSNESFGFIDAEQEDTNKAKFGVDISGADFGKAAEAMGALGFTVRTPEELETAFDKAKESDVPVVIDVKIGNRRPFPAEAMVLDPEVHTKEEIAAFRERYNADDLPTLSEIMATL